MDNLSAVLQGYSPRQLTAMLSAVCFVVLAAWLFFSERSLRRHLADIQAERRLLYLLSRWQQRDYGILFGFMLLCGLFLALMPDATSHKPTVSTTHTSETDLSALPPDAAEQASQPPSDPHAMMDLFATPTDLMPQQTALNALKSRYENALIGSYILFHCQRATQAELDLILKALRDDIIAYQADPANPPLDAQALYASIVSAAQGSYEMLYRHSECDSPQTQMLEEQFANFSMHFKAKEQAPALTPEADPTPSRKKALPRSDKAATQTH